MGVLPCDRKGCENVMCDYYSHKYGYLCWECREQLIHSMLSISDFMKSDKNEYQKPVNRLYEIDKEFKERIS